LEPGEVEEDAALSIYDDLVVVVEVEDGPRFRVTELGGPPVERGTMPADVHHGAILPTSDTTAEVMRRLALAHATGRPQRMAVDIPAGAYEVRVSPLAPVPGEPDRLVLSVQDRRRLQARRNIVNAAIVDALPGSVALLDGSGVIRAVNTGWVRFGLERSIDGVLADAGTDYLAVTDAAAATGDTSARHAAEAIRSVLSGAVDLAAADYPSESSGSAQWFTMRVAAVDVEGERWAVVAHEDVTAMRDAIDRWHSMFSNAAVPTLLIDGTAHIVDANAALAELLGHDLPTLIGRWILDFIHPADWDETKRRWAALAAGDHDVLGTREMTLVRNDGTSIIVTGHPSIVSTGASFTVVVQLIDITQQRRAEARLAVHRELLELVAAGTPLAEVMTAVAVNIGRVIDGSTGAVVLADGTQAVASDLRVQWLPFVGALGRSRITASAARRWRFRSAWSVPVPRTGGDTVGAVVILSHRDADADADELAAAHQLASVIRLAVQRDQAAAAAEALATAPPMLVGEDLAAAIERHGQSQGTLAVVAIGLNATEELVSQVGWRRSDAVGAAIANRAIETLPSGSRLAHRGRKLFALAPITDETDLEALGSGLRARLCEPIETGAADVECDIAVGVTWAAHDGASADAVLADAEDALAAALLADERVAVFADRMRRPGLRPEAERELRAALAAGEIVLHYQPVIDLTSGAMVSVEALLRWHHPDRGIVPPPELLATAARVGLVREMTALVLETACHDVAHWRADGATGLSVAVNLSGRELAEPDLVDMVGGAIERAGVDASGLVVEITESVVVDDVVHAAETLAALRTLGVKVAIDDFGTGYSSLVYLKQFPADQLKVDRTFVQGLGVNAGDTAIVDAVIGLGHRLGLEVVAEGVETDDQLTELRRRQCDHAQGYLLQRPVTVEEIDTFLARGSVQLGDAPTTMAEPNVDIDIDQMLSIVAHELSTPLSVIGGHAELLADILRQDDDSPASVIDALERNIKNLDDLLRSLGALSPALGPPGVPVSVDLGPFVEQATTDLSPLLAQHVLRRTIPSTPIVLAAEPVAIRQILTNLLSNAVKFTAAGTRIDVLVRTTDAHAEIVVADHGPGVPRERESELFGRFSRLGARERGLGLGLHLSQALARRQGGDLVHRRTRGGGATFVVQLPL
jgi:PAS domain S-box-containing protein